MKLVSACLRCGKPITANIPAEAFCPRCRYSGAPRARPFDAEFDSRGIALPATFDQQTEDIAADTYEFPGTVVVEPPIRQRDMKISLAKFLAWLAPDADVQAAGKRAVMLAHVAGQAGAKTDADLARKFKTSPARVSQLRREIVGIFPQFKGCNARQK